MSAKPIRMDPNIQYPDKWVLLEYVCECGKKIRVDSEPISPCAPQVYQHDCGKDEERCLPGPIIAIWEERDGGWIIVNRSKKRTAMGT
jgi:hypothetical protein